MIRKDTVEKILPLSNFWLRLVASFVFVLAGLTGNAALAADKFERYKEFAATSDGGVDHSAWDNFLGTYISETDDGRTIVNYSKVTDDDRESLQNYLDNLSKVKTAKLTKAEAYAYWVNLYNALTVEVILKDYPVSSIRRIGFPIGPWGRKLIRVNGKRLTLNNIEHDILRAAWTEPRTHYAVNCASYGCPNLLASAFTPENTEDMLQKAALDFINHPRGISVAENGKITASTIYKWYQVDFGDTEQGVLEHVRLFANDELLAKLEGKTKIDKYEYGWELNEK